MQRGFKRAGSTTRQPLVDEDGRKYDVITIIGPQRETKQLNFDITNGSAQ